MNFILELKDISKVIDYLHGKIDGKNVIVLLRGDLASGKTTLVKEYIKKLGLNENVTSPTFSIQSCYGTNVYHYDTYNKTLNEFIALGLLEEFEKEGLHFVEWGDEKLEELLHSYGFELIVVNITKMDNKREYIING